MAHIHNCTFNSFNSYMQGIGLNFSIGIDQGIGLNSGTGIEMNIGKNLNPYLGTISVIVTMK